MKISTEFHYGAPDDMRWSAIDDDTYDGAPDSETRNMIGYGRTEGEARDDLMRLFCEEDEYRNRDPGEYNEC